VNRTERRAAGRTPTAPPVTRGTTGPSARAVELAAEDREGSGIARTLLTQAQATIDAETAARTGPLTPFKRVIGRAGAPVTFAEGTEDQWVGHLAIHNGQGIIACQEFMERRYPETALADLDTPGAQIVEGAYTTRQMEPLRQFMSLVLADDPIPANLLDVAYMQELIDAIDLWFDQSGLKWLAELVKNSAARMSKLWAAQTEIFGEEVVSLVSGEARRLLKEQLSKLEIAPDGTVVRPDSLTDSSSS
jgi:hypothetical protein